MVQNQEQIITELAATISGSVNHNVVPEGLIVVGEAGTVTAIPASHHMEQRRSAVGNVLDRHLLGLDPQIRSLLIEDLLQC